MFCIRITFIKALKRYQRKLFPDFHNSTSLFSCAALCKTSNMENKKIMEIVKQAIPPLLESKHKGQAGRIGIVGGSKDYTGAPYFAAISALKVGCDLSHVFCTSGASQVIKSYSPELIVHPILDEVDALDAFIKWLPRLHTLVVGPGLGTDCQIHSVVKNIVLKAKEEDKLLVIDADGLSLITTEPDIIRGYSSTILTPNAMEFIRLYKRVIDIDLKLSDITSEHVKHLAVTLGGVTIIAKGKLDIISDGDKVLTCDWEGSRRRCGGQGDLLSGSLGTFLYWMHSYNLENDKEKCDAVAFQATLLGSFAACCLTRKCSYLAFQKKKRHMTTSDMIEEIPQAFHKLFSL